jgi:coenzyme F420-reducing hydrogenase alpha subunit
MSLEKVSEKNLERAKKLLNQLDKLQGANQMALKRNREEYDALIREGQALANQIAEAAEYVQDLEQAATD